MSLNTHSKIYYGHTVDDTNSFVDFDEGGGEIFAELNAGSYTLTEYVDELSRALNEAGALTYTVSVDRATRKITIAATGDFSLLPATGTHQGVSALTMAGFTVAAGDLSGESTYTGDAASGSCYTTQFKLQSFLAAADNQEATYATVNESASGALEVFSFGEKSFIEFNIRFATSRSLPEGSPIRNNPTGHEDLQALMRYLRRKAPVEFIPNESATGTFTRVVIESTPEDPKGLKYKLKELYDKNLPGFFETGLLRFRVTEG